LLSKREAEIAMNCLLVQDVLNWRALVQFEDGVKKLIRFVQNGK